MRNWFAAHPAIQASSPGWRQLFARWRASALRLDDLLRPVGTDLNDAFVVGITNPRDAQNMLSGRD